MSTRPGVEVTQALSESTTVVASPTLVPLMLGVCWQIIESLDEDGALNDEAVFDDEQYNQASLLITQAEFPDPRDNIDELEIKETEVGAYLYFGGALARLARGSNGTYGQAFLKLMNNSTKAGFLSSEFDSFSFDATTGDILTIALDVVNPVDTSQDVTITLLGTLTTTEVVDAINDAVGVDVAEVFIDTADDFGNGATAEYVLVSSVTFGAVSSVTVRAGTSALPLLFGSSFDDSIEYRVEGAGFWGQDDEDDDLTTPWIEFYRGEYTEDDVDTTFPALGVADAFWGIETDQAGDFLAAKAAAATYTGSSATVPLIAATNTVPGDQFWGDGTQVGSGEIIKVEASRFKIGKINTTLSTYDDDGEATNRVYDTIEVSTENHGTPFSPKYTYFRADGLEFGDITPAGEAGTLTGSLTGLVERAAQVMSGSDITFPLSAASLTLAFQVTEDGDEGAEVTYTFAGGPYANIAALVAALTAADEFSQFTVTNAANRLILSTTKLGADQAISLKSTGTANTALGFSAVAATADTGKDHEFATQSVALSDTIALPMSDLSSLAFDLVVVDSKGTHTLAATAIDLSAAADLGDVVDAIAEAFGGTAATDLTLYDGPGGSGVGGIPVATITSSGAADTHGTITITTTEGGATTTLELTAVDDDDGFRFLGFYDGTNGKYAEVDSAGSVADFIDLAGLWVIAGASGFELTILDGTNILGASDITIPAATYDADELAAAIAVAINALAPTTVTCVFDAAGTFTIDSINSSSITVGAHSGTDRSNDIFGTGHTAVQAASSWTGIAPDQAPLTIAFDFDDGTDSGTVTSPATYAMAQITSPEALAELLNDDDDFTGVTDITKRRVEWYSDDDDILSLRTIEGGTGATLDVAMSQPGFNAMGFDVSGAIAETGTAALENSDSAGADALKATTLIFQLDDNPHDYEIQFATNSLQDAIDDINTLVGSSGDVASESTSALTLTSLLEGAASKVFIDETNSTADTILGLTGEDEGSGRPNPDFYLDGTGDVNLGPNILRNSSSGIPFALNSALADIYITYEALRLDVTSSAEDAAMLEFEDVSTMEAAIGPISTKNPLALATFLALSNAPTTTVAALGIDEENDAAPQGTLDGWARALDFLESREVYAIAPLTEDEYIQGLLSTHVQAISEPEERGERVVLLWRSLPSRAVDTTVSSGEDGESNGTDNSFTLDTNPSSDLIANGIDPTDPIEYDDQLYLEVLITTLGSSELRRYSISDVNGVLLTFRTTFDEDEDENVDGFFSTTTFDETDLEDADWTLKIRGDELLVTGTTIADLGAIAAAAAEEGTVYAHRRVILLACNSVDTSINGITQNVEGFYAAACLAGMTAQQAPQQPFTNLPITGLGQVYGTDDTHSEKQMDTIADGGRWLLVNFGGAVVSRHQRTTATSSIEKREYSIVKAIDWLAKGLRSTNRVFIGRSVITTGFLDQLTMSNEGFLDYAQQLGVVRKADLTSLLQSTDDPDTVLIEVEVSPAYPCNKIAITIIS